MIPVLTLTLVTSIPRGVTLLFMSSRGDHRRRDRSWERDERDRDRVRDKGRYGSNRSGRAPNRDEKRRSSRSRSPRQGDRDKERDRDRKGLVNLFFFNEVVSFIRF